MGSLQYDSLTKKIAGQFRSILIRTIGGDIKVHDNIRTIILNVRTFPILKPTTSLLELGSKLDIAVL